MLIHRCPWCGEEISPLTFFNRHSDKLSVCPNCKNAIALYARKNGKGKKPKDIRILIPAVILILLIPFCPPFSVVRWENRLWLAAILYSAAIIALLLLLKIPYGKNIRTDDNIKDNQFEKSKCDILWEVNGGRGLLCPKIQVAEGEIFPACFTDENGQPISTALCVVLENIEWAGSCNCICDISFVSDDTANENLLCPGNRFYLYHRHSIIAEGAVKPAFE